MYQKFTATEIGVDAETKQIRIMFSNEVDPDSINSTTVYLNDINGVEFKTTYAVNSNEVLINLSEEIVPNEKYMLWITKDVSNMIGENLAVRVRKEIIFQTAIRSTVVIHKPYDFQEIEDELHLEFSERVAEKDDPPCLSYLVQISEGHLFENIVIESMVEETDIKLAGFKKNGQYYARVRAQKNAKDYGPWSKPVTVIVKIPEKEEEIEDIFTEEASILTTPENGITHESFIIEFNGDIDINSIAENSILLFQKKV